MSAVELPALDILVAAPRGFCAGVDRAIRIVELTIEKYGAPVYVRHEIVHNKYVVDDLKAKGAIFVEELDEVPDGVPVVFSAHGVPKAVPAKAEERGLNFLDATCPLVSKVHRQAERLVKDGHHILFIGHARHPEVIGTFGQVPAGAMTLIEAVEDVERLVPPAGAPLSYLSQTTLSVDDTAEIIAALRARFPGIAAPRSEDICYATSNRQAAVKAIAAQCDAMLVIGAPNSSNSLRLVEVAERHGVKARLIQRAADLDLDWLDGARTLGITAGASAPEILVRELLDRLAACFTIRIREVEAAVEDMLFKLPKALVAWMAVYTQVSTEEMIAFLQRYDHGTLISAKGIAEGVENSNYLIETTAGRFILTLYEKRVNAEDLPFFCALTDHLAARGLNIPRMLRDRRGEQLQALAGRPACLIEFLTGVSVTHPTPAQAYAGGGALGDMHKALADFRLSRPNSLDLAGWQGLAARCGGDLDRIHAGLGDRVRRELDWLDAHWPRHLARSVIHADLFPDNVLMLGDAVTGVIDFYFACTDLRAWDVAVTHSAWCFENDGAGYHAELGRALIAGYDRQFGLTTEERLAFPILARGACLRFLLTRAWDWLNTPADALVTRKDPMAFLRRLDLYAEADPEMLVPL